MSNAILALFIAIDVVGGSIQQISIPLWLNTWSYPMGVLLTCSIFYSIIFGVLMLLFSKRYFPNKTDWKTLFFAGFYDALNGIFTIYASQPNRVPSILQPFLLNFSIVASIIGNKFILKDKKKYNNRYVWISSLCIVLSIAIMSVPQFTQYQSESAVNFAVWTIIFIIGATFAAIFNVYQTQFYNNQNKIIGSLKVNASLIDDASAKPSRQKFGEFVSDSFLLLFYQSTIQLLAMFAFIWTDLLPFFGSSTPKNFDDNLKSMFVCNFTSQCSLTFMYYILFNIGYVLSYIGSCYLNVESAPFNMVVTTLVTPIVVIFWLIFPSINPSPNTIGYEYALPSLFLAVIGVSLWKYWENKEKNNNKTYLPVDNIEL